MSKLKRPEKVTRPPTVYALLLRMVLLVSALLISTIASAVLRIEITDTAGVQDTIPIAIVPFANPSGINLPDADISAIVSDDLTRSGRFNVLPANQLLSSPATTAGFQ